MTDLKPGWCILHPGEREPCRKCNSALRRARTRADLITIGQYAYTCQGQPVPLTRSTP